MLSGLSFAQKDWATCCSSVLFTLLAFFLSLLISKTPKKLSFSVCSYSLSTITYQYLSLLVGFHTLTYQKRYNRSLYVEGHQGRFVASAPTPTPPRRSFLARLRQPKKEAE